MNAKQWIERTSHYKDIEGPWVEFCSQLIADLARCEEERNALREDCAEVRELCMMQKARAEGAEARVKELERSIEFWKREEQSWHEQEVKAQALVAALKRLLSALEHPNEGIPFAIKAASDALAAFDPIVTIHESPYHLEGNKVVVDHPAPKRWRCKRCKQEVNESGIRIDSTYLSGIHYMHAREDRFCGPVEEET